MVQLGCERLFDDPRAFRLVEGRRVGLITNPSGVDRRLRSTADRLHARPGLDLVLLFGPEHGIRGDAGDGVPVETGVDPGTGVPAMSLYGGRRQPTPGELGQLDVLLFDIQDVGVRFYTYLYTMSLAMEACAAAGLPFVVLDRPNPLGGLAVEGNILDAPAFASFVGRYPIPVRYGLTLGELARLFNAEFGTGADLHVVEMRGWRRSMRWRETSLHWVPPSPNMPSPRTAAVYPGTCFFEGTNVSEGRGTARPFEQIGAPWIDGFALAERAGALGLPGAGIRPAFFRPSCGKHEGLSCGGIHLHASPDAAFSPVRSGFHLLAEVRRGWPEEFEWRTNPVGIHNFDKLAGTDRVRKALDGGAAVDDLIEEWAVERRPFEECRRRYLRYPA